MMDGDGQDRTRVPEDTHLDAKVQRDSFPAQRGPAFRDEILSVARDTLGSSRAYSHALEYMVEGVPRTAGAGAPTPESKMLKSNSSQEVMTHPHPHTQSTGLQATVTPGSCKHSPSSSTSCEASRGQRAGSVL